MSEFQSRRLNLEAMSRRERLRIAGVQSALSGMAIQLEMAFEPPEPDPFYEPISDAEFMQRLNEGL